VTKQRKIYFARAGDTNRIKIGCTIDVDKRLRVLQTGCPEVLRVLLILPRGDYQIETKLHKQFAKRRIQGEWFEYAPEIAYFIQKRLEARVRLKELEEEYLREKEAESYWEYQEQKHWAKLEQDHEEELERELSASESH
jgi:hypothetical protein